MFLHCNWQTEEKDYKIMFLRCNWQLKGLLHCFSTCIEIMEITASVISERMPKTGRENTKWLKSYKE